MKKQARVVLELHKYNINKDPIPVPLVCINELSDPLTST